VRRFINMALSYIKVRHLFHIDAHAALQLRLPAVTALQQLGVPLIRSPLAKTAYVAQGGNRRSAA
jgi:hypothetical protein